MILLDTCVLLWLASDSSNLSASAAQSLRGGQMNCFASAISAFEAGQKVSSGKLFLSKPVDEWFAGMLRRHQLKELPVSGIIAARATLLPAIHRDPFDRILIATAQHHSLALLTPDKFMAQYPNLKTIW
jgi:PIN domain nuclease of toxin-antitoxin system